MFVEHLDVFVLRVDVFVMHLDVFVERIDGENVSDGHVLATDEHVGVLNGDNSRHDVDDSGAQPSGRFNVQYIFQCEAV